MSGRKRKADELYEDNYAGERDVDNIDRRGPRPRVSPIQTRASSLRAGSVLLPYTRLDLVERSNRGRGRTITRTIRTPATVASTSSLSASSIASSVGGSSTISTFAPRLDRLSSIRAQLTPSTSVLGVMSSASSTSVVSDWTSSRQPTSPLYTSASNTPSVLSVNSSGFAVTPGTSSTSVEYDYAPPRASTSHAATGRSFQSLQRGARPIDGEEKFFMQQTPKGSRFLHSYAKALEEHESEGDVDCIICDTELFNNKNFTNIVVPLCGHISHEMCLRQWHEASGKTNCTICDLPIDSVADFITSAEDYSIISYPWSMARRPPPRSP